MSGPVCRVPATTGQVCTATGFGKLMIAGEYAVTRPGRSAIVMAVDRAITVRAARTGDAGTVTVHSGQRSIRHPIAHRAGTPGSKGRDRGGYVAETIARIMEFTTECRDSRQLSISHGIDLTVTSELDDPGSGTKYGLGSSAAVTAAVTAALCEVLALSLTPEESWKLGYLATMACNPGASGADLAAAQYGGWIDYRSPDRTWLAARAAESTIGELVSASWPGLSIERIERPVDDGGLVVGWSGRAASTPDLVARVTARLSDDFVARSDRLVAALGSALVAGRPGPISDGVRALQELLESLDRGGGAGIVTRELRALIDGAGAAGAAAKVSGAGGGDCCIALGATASVADVWRDLGYTVLPITSAPEGRIR